MDNSANDLSFLKNVLGKNQNEGASGVSNVFVQILLPLVLVLIFVAVMDIMKYKDVAENEKEKGRILIEKYYEKIDQSTLEKQKNYALIELQYQKLLRALEEVKKEKFTSLKLNLFPDAGRIRLQTINLVDEDFRHLCLKISQLFKSPLTEQAEKDDIYKAVITKTEEVLDSQMKTRIQARLPLVGNYFHETQDEAHFINGPEITPGNRIKIQDKVIEFVSALKVTTIELQIDLLRRIFQYLLENPEELDDNLKALADAMNQEKGKKKQELAKRFYLQLIEKLETRIDAAGFPFLQDTWNNLKILETPK